MSLHNAPAVLAFLRQQIEGAGNRVLGAGIVAGCCLDRPEHEWVYSRQRGYSLQVLLNPTNDEPSLYDVGGVSLKICLGHQTKTTVEPVFWFRLEGDAKAVCWRTMHPLIEAIDEVVAV